MCRLASLGFFRAVRAAPRTSCQARWSMRGSTSSAGLAALALNAGPSHSTIICSVSWKRRAPPRWAPMSARPRSSARRRPIEPGHLLGVDDLGAVDR